MKTADVALTAVKPVALTAVKPDVGSDRGAFIGGTDISVPSMSSLSVTFRATEARIVGDSPLRLDGVW